ncbi:MAG: YXWGXW repeat-containing protein, partial [Candidatus Acidiferrum sp.]
MRKLSFYSIRLLAIVSATAMFFALSPSPAKARVAVGIFVNFAPPELPVYAQPVCPGHNYIWTPGYWAWNPAIGDYYWVPGTWVYPPQIGVLWTPGYWAWGPDGFFFSAGYWGPTVGFYGGIDYGFGYFGHGYYGGRWEHGHFSYNRDVSNVNVSVIHNIYNARVNNEFRSVSRVSFNGGKGGVNARPTAQEEAAVRMRHMGPVAAQTRQLDYARSNRQFRASVNHGAPAIAATSKPGEFSGRGVMRTRVAGTVHTPPAWRANTSARENAEGRGRYVPAAGRSESSNSSNAAVNSRYQKGRNQLTAQQERERQTLHQQQNRER